MTRLSIDPLTRVEGHGRVELVLSSGNLVDVRVRLLESPRLFEKIVVWRKYDEVADLVCRICAICSAVHKLTALEALEQALEVDVPPLAKTLRELLLLGGHIQSHALHLFCLVLPDLTGVDSIVDLLKKDDYLAGAGLGLKAFGNHLQEVAGGRVIHPINPVVGGVSYRPQQVLLRELMADLDMWQQKWPEIAEAYTRVALFPPAKAVCGSALATGRAEAFSLSGDMLWTEQGGVVPASDYRRLLDEKPDACSYAKSSCGEDGPFLTGALARALLMERRASGRAPVPQQQGVYANNLAQISEIGWALERARELTEILLGAPTGAALLTPVEQAGGGIGTAVKEAPRGLLVHHYVLDEWGHVATADVVTPTAINQQAIQKQILADLGGEKDVAQIRRVAEQIVRAFDPCISCAVHLLET